MARLICDDGNDDNDDDDDDDDSVSPRPSAASGKNR